MRFVAAALATFCTIGGIGSVIRDDSIPPANVNLYDANPNHLWNRVHQLFHVRTAPDGSEYGSDTIDPLLWQETKHLLTKPSHAQAVALLDEFIAGNGERLISDPVKRAIFQHDLWNVFDWLVSRSDGNKAARNALMQRIARVIRRAALPRKTIEALPDNYAAAVASGQVLPRDLFIAKGPWVSIGGAPPVARQHADELGRSAFIVLWNLPGGREATVSYLRKLWDFPQPFIRDDSFPNDGEMRVKLNPALPPVPDGTRIALVRKMLLIDSDGVIVPSNIVESIQLRVFPGRTGFSELMMSRADLFAQKPVGLRETAGDDLIFLTFSSHGIDAFEQTPWRKPAPVSRLSDRCVVCHQVDFEPGVATVLSIRALLRPNVMVDSTHERWARWFTQPIVAAEAKGRRYEWGVLEGLWQSQPR